MDWTAIARRILAPRADRFALWPERTEDIQRAQLNSLLRRAEHTIIGKRYAFSDIRSYSEFAKRVPTCEYEDIRADVMRMIRGEKDILWHGRCRYFAQSSGTSGGRSKYIPVTPDSFQLNHYACAADSVGTYLSLNHQSRLFSGKGLILGGSFANTLGQEAGHAHVGDLSACLIDHTGPLASLFRAPSRNVALLADWTEKLPAIVHDTMRENITSLSGVPSWMLAVLNTLLKESGGPEIGEIWPNLEVFFHGGIAFGPYRRQYEELTQNHPIHYLENYNASEGFFAIQTEFSDRWMTLLIDRGVFFEFAPISGGDPIPIWEVEEGKTYALYITAPNGLWRYGIGDTVRIETLHPVRISIAGRTKSFINAFGEELMEQNADTALAAACEATGAAIADYTAAPVYATKTSTGRHQWLIEWTRAPQDIDTFAEALDSALRSVNSDYDAKRSAGGVFLSPPEITIAPAGLFARYLSTNGSKRLGGQRKVPRLRNDRSVIDPLLKLITST